MYRISCWTMRCTRESPHKRGDVPLLPRCVVVYRLISPQAWGCTDDVLLCGSISSNLPTSVGMYRREQEAIAGLNKSPHKRGDVPVSGERQFRARAISPQAWGCTAATVSFWKWLLNLPTSVGMYRNQLKGHGNSGESPHKRGDVPMSLSDSRSTFGISPQAWGCTEFCLSLLE